MSEARHPSRRRDRVARRGTHLPRRGKITGAMSGDDAKDVTRQVDLSKFGTTIDIKAPE